jgi:hypothetical protein
MPSRWSYDVRSALPVLAGLSLVLACLPASAQTIRSIEAGTVYGATVTVEHGVRVIRPLPHTRVIVPDVKPQAASNQPDTCAHTRTYLHQVGSEAGPSRYLRRIEGTQLLGSPR